jgi:transposase
MARHRSHSIEFKRQVAQEFIAGETLHALARRHDVSRNLIRVWVKKLETGAFDDDARAADLLQEYEAKIAALERTVGRQAPEIEFLKGALRNAPRPRSAITSVITGPTATELVQIALGPSIGVNLNACTSRCDAPPAGKEGHVQNFPE